MDIIAKKTKRWIVRESFHSENFFTRYTNADISFNDTIVNDWDLGSVEINGFLNEDKSEMDNVVNYLVITFITIIFVLTMVLTFLDYMCERYRPERNVDRIGRQNRMRNIDEQRPPATAMMIHPERNSRRLSPLNESNELEDPSPEEEPQDDRKIEKPPITEHSTSDDEDKTGLTATLNETQVKGELSKEKVDETEMRYIDDEESENETG